MKTTLYFTLTLLALAMLAFVPNSFAQDHSPEYVVRAIYFYPNDLQPHPEIDTVLDYFMKDFQKHFADRMEFHGFGRKTFLFEADEKGNTIVHQVKGNFNDAHYRGNTYSKVLEEFYSRFGKSKNIDFFVVDTRNQIGSLPSGEVGHPCGIGIGHSDSGFAVVPAYGDCFGVQSIGTEPGIHALIRAFGIHELLHAFGMLHDYSGPFELDLTSCAAEWLDGHRFFNQRQNSVVNDNTTIKMLPPTLVSPPATIRLRFEITDPDGLHQAQLIKSGDPIIACQKLNGKNAIAEFETTELFGVSTIHLQVVDAHGNFTFGGQRFPIDIINLLPPAESISIPDRNLAATVREQLGLASGDPVTQLDMLRLTRFQAVDRQITDLTGLEHAMRLSDLNMLVNQIKDITPLSKLTNLWKLSIGGNRISDLTPFKSLTNLNELSLGYNPIGDITVLPLLKNLQRLSLDNNPISDISRVWELTQLRELRLRFLEIRDISRLTKFTGLELLQIDGTQVSDISPLAGLTDLNLLTLRGNNISDVSSLVANTGLGIGDEVSLNGNPLSYLSIYTHIPTLQERGVKVDFDNRIPNRIRIVSGDDQRGSPGAALEDAFVVEVQDESGVVFEGVPVTFTVTAGSGTLSTINTATDASGRAESILTLGPNPRTNTVTVSVTEIQVKSTFTAKGVQIPKRLEIVSGNDQEGLPGAALANPFVAEVRDQSGEPLPGAEVTFSVSSGGGTLSTTSATTDSDGRAESTLRLGPKPGANTVTVSVAGIQVQQTFNAEGIRIPKTFVIVSGDDQQGLPGAALEHPFAVEVRDQFDKSFPGAQVTFAVTSGGGTLSVTSGTTDSDGKAESTLTLGQNPGTNTVGVTVTGVQGKQTFTAEGVQIPKTFVIISGENQQGLPGAPLVNPFVVEVLDPSDNPLPGVQVTFSVTSGGGRLSATTATTDSDGRAESTLTLGPKPGANTVTVSVAGIQEEMTFTAEGVQIPMTFVIISGENQQGLPGAPLVNPFVVEVLDPSDNPLPGVQVTFSVTSGGGRLSATTATTDSDGRAESTLTLGPKPGANTVTVSVAGIQEVQTFSAEGIRTPRAFWIISGFDQKGVIGEPLPRPIIVEVRGQSGEPFPDAQVTFTVTSGGGTLSVISVTTDSNGRAMSTLTLGPNPGTNSVEVAVTRIQEKQTVSAIGELPPIPEDVNMDDVVNILDLVSVASVLGDKGTDLAADVNGDGIVNILDLVKVAGALGDAAAAPSAWYRDLEIAPTRADVGEWLAQAQGLDLTDATPQRGVLFLEQLMAVLTPKETALLANFPNPFNPETWIPYQLAGDADVTLTIYDTSGIMVRRLDLGHQLAGFYTNRGNAAHWDGRNENGESVSSGVYFYQLGTPSFRQIRRMVILK